MVVLYFFGLDITPTHPENPIGGGGGGGWGGRGGGEGGGLSHEEMTLSHEGNYPATKK